MTSMYSSDLKSGRERAGCTTQKDRKRAGDVLTELNGRSTFVARSFCGDASASFHLHNARWMAGRWQQQACSAASCDGLQVLRASCCGRRQKRAAPVWRFHLDRPWSRLLRRLRKGGPLGHRHSAMVATIAPAAGGQACLRVVAHCQQGRQERQRQQGEHQDGEEAAQNLSQICR